MTDRLLEDGTQRRTEDSNVRILEEAVVVIPPDYEPPVSVGVTTRLLEDGTVRRVEDGFARLLESLPAETVTGPRPFRFGFGPSSSTRSTVELSDFPQVSLSASRADGWTLSTSVPGSSVAARQINELATDVFVTRFAQEWRRLRILTAEQEWDEDGGGNVAVAAVDYRGVWNRRFLTDDLVFTDEPQGDIAYGLIDHAQGQVGGDYGMLPGELDDTITRSRSYLTGDNIGERLRELSEVIDGPWYEVDADLTFHARARGTERRYSIPLQLGSTARRLRRGSGAAQFANAVQGTGDNEQTVREFWEDPDLATDPRGRWETTAAWSTVIQQSTLAEHTEAEGERRVSPFTTWTATIDSTRWLTDFPIVPFDVVEIVVPRDTAAPVGVPTDRVLAQVDTISFSVTKDGEVTSIEATFVEIGVA